MSEDRLHREFLLVLFRRLHNTASGRLMRSGSEVESSVLVVRYDSGWLQNKRVSTLPLSKAEKSYLSCPTGWNVWRLFTAADLRKQMVNAPPLIIDVNTVE